MASTGKSKSGGAARSRSAASSRAKSSSARSSNGSSGSSRSGSSRSGSSRTSSSQSRSAQSQNGVVGKLKNAGGTVVKAADKAKGPAITVGAAAAGVAGGLALKRMRPARKRVLGVPVPRSLTRPSVPELDVKSVAKTVGKASKQFGQTSKSVSKDIERVGDQAERIGKILG